MHTPTIRCWHQCIIQLGQSSTSHTAWLMSPQLTWQILCFTLLTNGIRVHKIEIGTDRSHWVGEIGSHVAKSESTKIATSDDVSFVAQLWHEVVETLAYLSQAQAGEFWSRRKAKPGNVWRDDMKSRRSSVLRIRQRVNDPFDLYEWA